MKLITYLLIIKPTSCTNF